METTEHITEAYVRHVLGWFTNSNIKAKGGKEIDILAIDVRENKYHIESGVTHKKNWALKSKRSKEDFDLEKGKTKWKHRNSVDFFIKEKFNDKRVIEKLIDFDFNDNYKKIIVVWQVANNEVFEYGKSKGVEVWELKDKVKNLMNSLGETYYSDDILRTLQLVNKVNEERKKGFLSFLKQKIYDKNFMRIVKEGLKEV